MAISGTDSYLTALSKLPVEILGLLNQERERLKPTVQPRRPLIVIPGSITTTQTAQWPVYGSDAASIEFLRLAGGNPQGITTSPLIEGHPLDVLSSDEAFNEAFDRIWSTIMDMHIRGLCVAGGEDLYSIFYGQHPHPQSDDPSIWRQLWERYLLLLAHLLRLPVFGICLGMHHMNVVLGGGLIQDLRSQWPRGHGMPRLVRHRSWRTLSPETFVFHPVLVNHKSKLARLVQFGTNAAAESDFIIRAVRSMHKQAVGFVTPDGRLEGYVAPGQTIAAISFDGVIEALEDSDPTRTWFGTQWHPEWDLDLPWARGIFRGFVQDCAAYNPLPPALLEEYFPLIRAWVRLQDQHMLGWSAIQGTALRPPPSTRPLYSGPLPTRHQERPRRTVHPKSTPKKRDKDQILMGRCSSRTVHPKSTPKKSQVGAKQTAFRV